MANIIQVTPFMLVPKLEAALDFMTGVLGFGIDVRMWLLEELGLPTKCGVPCGTRQRSWLVTPPRFGQ